MEKRIYVFMPVDPNQFFKILGDQTRLRVLTLLSLEGELCVCVLTHALDELQPKISRHLALLRESTLLLDRRQGQWVYYRVNPHLPGWMRAVLAETAKGVAAKPPFSEDGRTLKHMPNRPGSACCA